MTHFNHFNFVICIYSDLLRSIRRWCITIYRSVCLKLCRLHCDSINFYSLQNASTTCDHETMPMQSLFIQNEEYFNPSNACTMYLWKLNGHLSVSFDNHLSGGRWLKYRIFPFKTFKTSKLRIVLLLWNRAYQMRINGCRRASTHKRPNGNEKKYSTTRNGRKFRRSCFPRSMRDFNRRDSNGHHGHKPLWQTVIARCKRHLAGAVAIFEYRMSFAGTMIFAKHTINEWLTRTQMPHRNNSFSATTIM